MRRPPALDLLLLASQARHIILMHEDVIPGGLYAVFDAQGRQISRLQVLDQAALRDLAPDAAWYDRHNIDEWLEAVGVTRNAEESDG